MPGTHTHTHNTHNTHTSTHTPHTHTYTHTHVQHIHPHNPPTHTHCLSLSLSTLQLHLHMSGPRSCSRDSKLSERVFLLLVGLDHVLVGLVMEGVVSHRRPHTHSIRVYVSEAKQLIARLDAQDIFNTSTSRSVYRHTFTFNVCVYVCVCVCVCPTQRCNDLCHAGSVSLDRVLTVHLSTPLPSPHSLISPPTPPLTATT